MFTITVHPLHPSGIQKPPGVKVRFCICLLFVCHSFFALVQRPNDSIFKTVVEANQLMTTERSACAMKFSARSHVMNLDYTRGLEDCAFSKSNTH